MGNKAESFLSRTRRNKGSVLLIMLSLIMAYFAIFLWTSFRKNVIHEYYDSIDYQYKYRKSFSYFGKKPEEILKKNVSGCNFTAKGVAAYSDNSKKIHIMDVLLHCEEPMYPFVEGGFPEHSEIVQRPLVILGINWKEYCRKDNGQYYYMLQDEEYEVAGFISSGRSVAFDYDILVFWENMGVHLKEHLMQQSDSVIYSLESNRAPVAAVYERLAEGNSNIMELPDTDMSASAVPDMGEERYCLLLYVFAFAAVVVSVTLWLDRRGHELSVRRTYGYSYVDIFFLVLKELSVYTVAGCIVSFLFLLGFNQIFSLISTEFHTKFDWLLIVGMLVATEITAFLVTLVQMLRLVALKPIELLRIRR